MKSFIIFLKIVFLFFPYSEGIYSEDLYRRAGYKHSTNIYFAASHHHFSLNNSLCNFRLVIYPYWFPAGQQLLFWTVSKLRMRLLFESLVEKSLCNPNFQGRSIGLNGRSRSIHTVVLFINCAPNKHSTVILHECLRDVILNCNVLLVSSSKVFRLSTNLHGCFMPVATHD